MLSMQATVPVPNGEYLSSLHSICRVSLGGVTRGSRDIIVALPGEPGVHLTHHAGTVVN